MSVDYQEALNYIHGTYKFGSKLGLENIKTLLRELGNPEKGLKVIHVAGTNGKGSTCSMIQSVLIEAGYKVGLYTSPYIERFNERIRINTTNIEDQELASMTEQVKRAVERMLKEGFQHPTEFEIVTAIALLYYQEQKVDFVILEVGLGGRLDATNVISDPLLTIITPIDYDHMTYLGNTLEAIAGEKAGIIKKGRPVITGFQHEEALEIIKKKALLLETPFYHVVPEQLEIHESHLKSQTFSVTLFQQSYHKITIALPGLHQVENSMLALTAIKVLEKEGHLKIGDQELRKGLENVRWIGRLEVIHEHPIVLIDGAHNLQGAKALSKSIEMLLKKRSITWVVGMLEDKDVDNVLNLLLPKVDQVIVTEPDCHRAMRGEILAEKIRQNHSKVSVEPNIEKAVTKALETTDKSDVILCAGSLYMLGAIRSLFQTENN